MASVTIPKSNDDGPVFVEPSVAVFRETEAGKGKKGTFLSTNSALLRGKHSPEDIKIIEEAGSLEDRLLEMKFLQSDSLVTEPGQRADKRIEKYGISRSYYERKEFDQEYFEKLRKIFDDIHKFIVKINGIQDKMYEKDWHKVQYADYNYDLLVEANKSLMEKTINFTRYLVYFGNGKNGADITAPETFHGTSESQKIEMIFDRIDKGLDAAIKAKKDDESEQKLRELCAEEQGKGSDDASVQLYELPEKYNKCLNNRVFARFLMLLPHVFEAFSTEKDIKAFCKQNASTIQAAKKLPTDFQDYGKDMHIDDATVKKAQGTYDTISRHRDDEFYATVSSYRKLLADPTKNKQAIDDAKAKNPWLGKVFKDGSANPDPIEMEIALREYRKRLAAEKAAITGSAKAVNTTIDTGAKIADYVDERLSESEMKEKLGLTGDDVPRSKLRDAMRLTADISTALSDLSAGARAIEVGVDREDRKIDSARTLNGLVAGFGAISAGVTAVNNIADWHDANKKGKVINVQITKILDKIINKAGGDDKLKRYIKKSDDPAQDGSANADKWSLDKVDEQLVPLEVIKELISKEKKEDKTGKLLRRNLQGLLKAVGDSDPLLTDYIKQALLLNEAKFNVDNKRTLAKGHTAQNVLKAIGDAVTAVGMGLIEGLGDQTPIGKWLSLGGALFSGIVGMFGKIAERKVANKKKENEEHDANVVEGCISKILEAYNTSDKYEDSLKAAMVDKDDNPDPDKFTQENYNVLCSNSKANALAVRMAMDAYLYMDLVGANMLKFLYAAYSAKVASGKDLADCKINMAAGLTAGSS